MRYFIGGQEIATPSELAELALGLGVDPELWLGAEAESEEERAARLDAATDILTDSPELAAPVVALTVAAIERMAPVWAVVR